MKDSPPTAAARPAPLHKKPSDAYVARRRAQSAKLVLVNGKAPSHAIVDPQQASHAPSSASDDALAIAASSVDIDDDVADSAQPNVAGAWQLPSDCYRHAFEQAPAPTIYGPLTINCGRVVVEPFDGIALPVVHLCTFAPARPIRDDDVLDLTCFLTNAISSGKQFLFFHDLRHLWPSPTQVQVRALISFVRTNKKHMDRQLQATAIVVANPMVRGLVNFLIWIFRPSQPVKFFKDHEEALNFLKHHFPEGEPARQGRPTTR